MGNNIEFMMKVKKIKRNTLLNLFAVHGVKISRRTLYSRLSGETEFKLSEITALIKILEASFEDIFNIEQQNTGT